MQNTQVVVTEQGCSLSEGKIALNFVTYSFMHCVTRARYCSAVHLMRGTA